MQNAPKKHDESIEFQPRQFLKRDLTPPFWAKVIYALGLLYVPLQCYLTYQLGFSALNMLMMLAMLAVTQFVFFPIAFSSYSVTPESIKVTLRGKTKEIAFTDVASVNYGYLPYCGGFISIVSLDKRMIWFTGFLSRADYILEGIAAKRPDLDTPSLRQCRKHLIKAEHDQSRIKRGLKSPKFWIGAVLASATAWFVQAPIDFVCVVFLSSTLACETALAIAHERALRKDPNNVKADMIREKKFGTFAWVMIIAAILSYSFIMP